MLSAFCSPSKSIFPFYFLPEAPVTTWQDFFFFFILAGLYCVDSVLSLYQPQTTSAYWIIDLTLLLLGTLKIVTGDS